MAQLLYYQISVQRPYLIRGDKSYLLGFAVSHTDAVLQVIEIKGWFDELPFALLKADKYSRGNLSPEVFYVRFLNKVIEELFSGLNSWPAAATLFKNPSPTIRFSSKLNSLPLFSSFGTPQQSNLLRCKLREFTVSILPTISTDNILFSHPACKEFHEDISIVIKASGIIKNVFTLLY